MKSSTIFQLDIYFTKKNVLYLKNDLISLDQCNRGITMESFCLFPKHNTQKIYHYVEITLQAQNERRTKILNRPLKI